MAYGIASLTRSLYITDIESVIALVWTRYQRTPGNTIPLLRNQIISLPYRQAEHGRDPESLTKAMTSDLQSVFDRIYPVTSTRRVSVSTSYDLDSTGTRYDVVVTFSYQTEAGDIEQTGAKIWLGKDGRFIIPESNLDETFV